MKNVFLLEADKPSRLYYNNNDKELQFCKVHKSSTPLKQNKIMYITSNEEIKIGDWYKTDKFIWQMKYPKWGEEGQGDAKKIVLSTDLDLIKDGVQKIDDDFLEWFINNPSCEEVKIFNNKEWNKGKCDISNYEIIVPKDKVMQRFIDNAKNREIDNCNYFDIEIGCVKEVCKCEGKQPLIDMMQDDEELGLYNVPNIIDDWLEKNGDPEITKQVVVEAGELHLYSERLEKYSERSYNEEDMLTASKYGYNFHKTTQFPNQEFEESCIRNTQQWLTTFKK